MERNLFKKLETEIKALTTQETHLKRLYAMTRKGHFDDEDRKFVQTKIAQLRETKSNLENVLKRKKAIYDSQIKQMEEKLQQRHSELDQFCRQSKVFQDFPDILDYFSSKQARLNAVLNGVKQKLVS